MAKRQVAVADCETDPFKINRVPAPFIWGFYDGTIYQQFYNTKDFIDYVKNQEIILYAHNGGKFDWHFIKEYISADQKIMVINGRLSSFKIGLCEFRDSYNLLPVPLASYQKTEIDYSIFEKEERNKPNNKREIEAYLKDDCVFLYQLVTTFIENYGLNLTLASSAMKYWRKNFYTGKPFNSSKMFFETMKKYYYGGRVECFEKGIIEKEFSVYDINSAYPEAMSNNHAWGTEIKILDKLPKHYAQCFITLSCISAGAFPFREKSGLTFPNDNENRIYTITGWELKAAKELKLLKEVEIIKVVKFCDMINFSAYVQHFFAMKAFQKGKDAALYLIAKLFLNSLYGKFAANPMKYKDYWTIPAEQIALYQNETNFVFTSMLGLDTAIVEQPLPEEEQRFYNVATAASVTGFVRAKLLRGLKTCNKPLYCDTDSIACQDDNSKNVFPISEKLGDWEKEGDFVQAAIAGKKLYAFKLKTPYVGKDGKRVTHKKASKGVKLCEKDIFAIASGEKVIYNSEAPTFSIKDGVKFISRSIQLT